MGASEESDVSTEVLRRLRDELTDDMVNRLVAYAAWKAGRLVWQGMLGAPMPEGLEPKDIAFISISKVIEGRWRLDPEKHSDLYHYLTSVIDSVISKRATSWANRHIRNESVIESQDPTKKKRNFDRQKAGSNPEEDMLAQELEQAADDFFWAFHNYLKNEPFLQKIIEQIFEGRYKRREVADALGVTETRITNGKKRLQRKIDKFLEKQGRPRQRKVEESS